MSELVEASHVTATAVRQRLMRLMSQRLIQREPVRAGRGRPKHFYRLTEKGLRLTGSNFTDLARALWREIGMVEDSGLREEMVARIARALAAQYADQIAGSTPAERMRSLAELLAQRRIPVAVEDLAKEVVMTTRACPYPRLAEQDRTICEMEKLLYSELLGQDVELTQCILDGGGDCRFHAK